MNIQPINNVILVRPDSPKFKTSGGIHLPTKPIGGPFKRGTVLSIGSGKLLGNGQRVPVPCKVGDVILFAPSKDEVVVDDQKCCLIRASDIMAVETKEVQNV